MHHLLIKLLRGFRFVDSEFINGHGHVDARLRIAHDLSGGGDCYPTGGERGGKQECKH